MKEKIILFAVLSLLLMNNLPAQVGGILFDSILIKIGYEKINDTAIKINYTISNHSSKNIYISGDWDKYDLKIQTLLIEENDSTNFFSVGWHDPSYNLISKSDLFLVEIPAYKTWKPKTSIVIKNISFLKAINLTYLKDSEYEKIKLKCSSYKMVSAKKYQQSMSHFKIEFY